MDVILDTNAFFHDFRMESDRFRSLFDYIDKTGDSRLIMPEIVFMELEQVYRRHLSDHVKKVRNATEDVNKMSVSGSIAIPAFDIDANVNAYCELVKLKFRHGSFAPLKPEYLHDVVRRAVRRQRPCSSEGEEIRDALLWLTVLDCAPANPDYPIAFISNNSGQFAKEKSSPELHADLLRECGERKRSVSYFLNLQAFIHQVASKIEWISEDWIRDNVDVDEVNDLALELLEEEYLHELSRTVGSSYYTTKNFHVISVSLELDSEFFVYENSDETLYVEASFYGSCTVGFSVYRDEYWRFDTGAFETEDRLERTSEQCKISATVGFRVEGGKASHVKVISARL